MHYRELLTSNPGYFVTGSVGYVLTFSGPYNLGAHLIARYYASSAKYQGSELNPWGYQLGGGLSLSFDGAPLL